MKKEQQKLINMCCNYSCKLASKTVTVICVRREEETRRKEEEKRAMADEKLREGKGVKVEPIWSLVLQVRIFDKCFL